jgi:hypothetical protein
LFSYSNYSWFYNSTKVITTATLQPKQQLLLAALQQQPCHHHSQHCTTTTTFLNTIQVLVCSATAAVTTALQSHCHHNSSFTPQSLSGALTTAIFGVHVKNYKREPDSFS